MFYELSPRFDSRKSFYKKAMVEDSIDENKAITKILYSYETPVVKYTEKNDNISVLDFDGYANYSSTTRRHVWDFVRQLGIPCFMKMYEHFKFKSLPDFLRKVDKLVYNESRGTITLWKNDNVYHVYNFLGE